MARAPLGNPRGAHGQGRSRNPRLERRLINLEREVRRLRQAETRRLEDGPRESMQWSAAELLEATLAHVDFSASGRLYGSPPCAGHAVPLKPRSAGLSWLARLFGKRAR